MKDRWLIVLIYLVTFAAAFLIAVVLASCVIHHVHKIAPIECRTTLVQTICRPLPDGGVEKISEGSED